MSGSAALNQQEEQQLSAIEYHVGGGPLDKFLINNDVDFVLNPENDKYEAILKIKSVQMITQPKIISSALQKTDKKQANFRGSVESLSHNSSLSTQKKKATPKSVSQHEQASGQDLESPKSVQLSGSVIVSQFLQDATPNRSTMHEKVQENGEKEQSANIETNRYTSSPLLKKSINKEEIYTFRNTLEADRIPNGQLGLPISLSFPSQEEQLKKINRLAATNQKQQAPRFFESFLSIVQQKRSEKRRQEQQQQAQQNKDINKKFQKDNKQLQRLKKRVSEQPLQQDVFKKTQNIVQRIQSPLSRLNTSSQGQSTMLESEKSPTKKPFGVFKQHHKDGYYGHIQSTMRPSSVRLSHSKLGQLSFSLRDLQQSPPWWAVRWQTPQDREEEGDEEEEEEEQFRSTALNSDTHYSTFSQLPTPELIAVYESMVQQARRQFIESKKH